MNTNEYVGNLHVHTPYSDGEALHREIAKAAAEAGIDFVVVTDHNVWVDGCESYDDNVLLLVGEEIHDVRRVPQANHLLTYNVNAEIVGFASTPQEVIDETVRRGGLCYIAHPFERDSPVGPDLGAIPWVDWHVTGYTGLEIWNYMSEFKGCLRNRLSAVIAAYFPAFRIRGPYRASLARWDNLLSRGMRLSAIGGADAHGSRYTLGPFARVLFPYLYLFRCVNTHVLTEQPLNGILGHDRSLIYGALKAGRTWVGYDLAAPTRGFRFEARSSGNRATIGDELGRTGATVFEVNTPRSADIRLLVNGRVVARSRGKNLRYTTVEAGAYRVEAYRRYRLGSRGWIFSSPIYVT